MVIKTKFDIGDELFYICSRIQKEPYRVRIEDIEFDNKKYKIRYSDSSLETFKFIVFGVKEENLYRTEAEAYKRLDELQESKKWVGI